GWIDKASPAFDCFLLDIKMPGTSGIELCARIRKLQIYRRTPIVMVTAMSGRVFIDGAFAAGATDYITKPLDRLELKARIGMAARLHEERKRLADYALQNGLSVGAAEKQIEFDEPFLIPGIDRAIELMALENYLLTLGRKSAYSYAALGIHVPNAAIIYTRADAPTFIAMLSDVALAICDGLKTTQMLLAYAGNGNFVGLASRSISTDLEELEKNINFSLSDFKDIYQADRLPLPEVRVGELIRGSVFSLNRPTKILDQAIRAAQPTPRKMPKIRLLAG
ncbi:PleD family two-component system response regulator, partial [Phaeovulum sp.]|uniref:response regulator n=1 Tax=Phaeovulum sp. TaxID=2934796 RepID=UPI003562E322